MSGRDTLNEKQVQVVGENFMRALDPTTPQNRFLEYVFNKFGNEIPKEMRYQLKAHFDNMPYDEKYNKARRLNPDEDSYYIQPVTSFSDIYKRKKMLDEAIDSNNKKMKEIIEKMNKLWG